MNICDYSLALNLIPGMGPVRIRRLLDAFASPEIILHSPASLLQRVQGIGPELAALITGWRKITNPVRERENAERAGVRITTLFDDEYPDSLRTLYDPPLVLYSRGVIGKSEERSLSIVGSRQAGYYGLTNARRFSSVLAETGVTIISGLARGVDSAAHEGALAAGGRTIAVIGSGLNCLYPPENGRLAQRIEEQGGAVVSELPMNMSPSRTTFPLRNRLVSGWSQGLLLSEAPERSGSLITARLAMEQGRRVFAIPGGIDSSRSAGCHELIRNGATLVTRPEEILEEFGWAPMEEGTMSLFAPACTRTGVPEWTDSDERRVAAALEEGYNTIDALCQAAAFTAPDITCILTRLQIRRLVVPEQGGRFKLRSQREASVKKIPLHYRNAEGIKFPV